MKVKPKVLCTTLRRSHFIQVASSLVAYGIDADLFQGWIVRNPRKSILVRLAARILRRESFIYGFEKRLTPELINHNYSDFASEFIQAVLEMTVGRINNWLWNLSVKIGFALHGWRAIRLLKKNKYNIIHVRSGMGIGGLTRFAKKHGVKILVDHSAGAPDYISEYVYGHKLKKSSYWYSVKKDCDSADILMVDCDWVRETFLMYGYPVDKIRVVYMGLDEKFNGLKKWDRPLEGIGKTIETPLKIVFSGPFAPHKGNHDFLQAVETLSEKGLFFNVDVLGSVNILKKDQMRYAKAIAKINFHGHLSQDKMCEIMKCAHIYLFPSLSEGCAKSAFEAMSMGLCVVATKQTGLPITEGVDGHLITVKNPNSIVEKILELVDNPKVISQTGRAATKTLKKFSWSHYAENVERVYNELLEK